MGKKTLFEAVNNNFDNPDFTTPVKPGCYNIVFQNEGRTDETQFDLHPGETFRELEDLWEVFRKENSLTENVVESVGYAGELDETVE